MAEAPDSPRRLPRPLRPLVVVLGALALAWVSLHALVDRAAVRERIRARAVQALEARLPGAALGDDVRVDWLFRASVGPLTVPASAPGAPPVLGVGRVTARPALWPLLSGRLEPGSIRLLGVRFAPGPEGQEAVRLVERLGARRAAAPGASPADAGGDPAFRLRDVVVTLERGGRSYALGPFDADVERRREPGLELVSGELRLAGGGRATATLRRPRTVGQPAGTTAPLPGPKVPGGERSAGSAAPVTAPGGASPSGQAGAATPAERREGAWSVTARLEASVADLPDWLRRRAVAATAGAVTLEVEAAGHAGGGVASLRGTVTGLTLAGAPLGPEPVGPLRLDGEATAAYTRSDGRLAVERATLRLGRAVALRLSGGLGTRGDLPFEASAALEPVDYPALLAALPAALVPPPQAPRPAGAVGGALAVAGSLRGARPWTLQASVDLSGMKEAARHAPPSPLRLPFTAHLAASPPPSGPAAAAPGGAAPARSEEKGPAILVGPDDPAFVPVAELPEHVVRCITTSEDAGFFGHQGFDFDELRNAVAAGAQAGKLLRGGSTITQQLAKNLYLSRDRSLARKAREALITVALEGTVPKARLLEIYLNVIEWGPELHGLGRAARHYLDKDARSLTPREACFLATLIPSPVRSHGALAAGVPAWRWSARVDDLLMKLQAVGLLDDDALARELSAPLALASWVPRQAAPPDAGGPAAAEGSEGREDEAAPPDAAPVEAAPPEAGPPEAGPAEGGPRPGPAAARVP